ncbi:MAG: hypothetical protein ACK5PR_02040, partial [bacterium]
MTSLLNNGTHSSIPPPLVTPMHDSELAAELQRHLSEGRSRWHVIANAFSIRVFSNFVGQNQWDEVGMGDLGNETHGPLKTAAKAKRLSWENVASINLAEVSPELSNPTMQSVPRLNDWIKHRDNVTKGRHGDISNEVKAEVASLAAWRC